MNPQQSSGSDQGSAPVPGANIPDNLIKLLTQLQRNRKYGGFGAPSNPTGDRA